MEREHRFYTTVGWWDTTYNRWKKLQTEEEAIASAKAQVAANKDDSKVFIVEVRNVVRKEVPEPPPIIVERF